MTKRTRTVAERNAELRLTRMDAFWAEIRRAGQAPAVEPDWDEDGEETDW